MDDRYIYTNKNKILEIEKKKAISKTGTKQILYYDNQKIRHMERMFDLFMALFR